MAGPELQQILEAARNRVSGAGAADTLVVASHLAQMRLFMLRQGVEFYAEQDTTGQRRKFIKQVVEWNQLEGRLDAIIDNSLIDGRGLLYFKPSKDLYRINYFRKDQYRTFVDEDDQLELLRIVYSFKVKPSGFTGGELVYNSPAADGNLNGAPFGNTRWIRVDITAATVTQWITTQDPGLDGDVVFASQREQFTNSFGFIPAVEIFMNRGLESGSGRGEFDHLEGHILAHDKMEKAIHGNLNFFGNPTLVSSRPKTDLIEADDNTERPTISSKAGFSALGRPSTRSGAYSASFSGGGIRVPRIIANVEAADRVGYIHPDAVSGDQVAYAQRKQEMIRAALGGVDDLSISAGATAYEIKSSYGRVAATATHKCRDMFSYGFCKLFAMMVAHEETIFRESLAVAKGRPKPVPPLRPDFPDATPEEYQKTLDTYKADLDQWNQDVQGFIAEIRNTGEIPPGTVGLIPDGSVSILWRWLGQVFEDSPQEILQNSIVCRNLQELGVSSIEAIQYLFPQKTPEERAAMLTGYPFRMVEATQRSAGVFLDMLRGMYQVPHPQEPDLPIAADPGLDVVPFIYRTLEFLKRELSYSPQYQDYEPGLLPDTLSDLGRALAQRGLPTDEQQQRDASRSRAFADRLAAAWPGASSPNGANLSGPPGMGAGLSGSNGVLPSDLSPYALPAMAGSGSLIFDPTALIAGSTGQLGATGSSPTGPGSTGPGPTGAGPTGAGSFGGLGAPDLAAASNAGVFGPAPSRRPGPTPPARAGAGVSTRGRSRRSSGGANAPRR